MDTGTSSTESYKVKNRSDSEENRRIDSTCIDE